MRAILWTDLSKTEIKVNESRKLTGKVAIVFGGSRGIGAAAARRLANEGADVAVTHVSAPERAAETVGAIEAAGRTGLAIKEGVRLHDGLQPHHRRWRGAMTVR
ncbi:SDR family NAD(P)-dependent oxidoreductase [Burkholderia sp. L27(2015)]|uniref:SDR family NAD(P)-dependent oxidoreductase n=1 Tax=Burkholderia sp. L27(2015) TaxID=1641858 RepID=UPI00131BBF70|nr:SDR family NAD(P)-dependent oxidoreductase [Burkholderia sp. L27(2015)]